MRILPLVVATAILLSASPAFAAMPGEPCTQVGATQMSQDRQHILACLETGNPDNPMIWKSSTSGGSGITGGCKYVQAGFVQGAMNDPSTGAQIEEGTLLVFAGYSHSWGKGCVNGVLSNPYNLFPNGMYIGGGPQPGYSCGPDVDDVGDPWTHTDSGMQARQISVMCVKGE